MLWLVLNMRCAYCRLARCALLAQMAMPHLMLLPAPTTAHWVIDQGKDYGGSFGHAMAINTATPEECMLRCQVPVACVCPECNNASRRLSTFAAATDHACHECLAEH